MTPRNTLAKLLLKKKIVTNVTQANFVSIGIFSLIILICLLLIMRNLSGIDSTGPRPPTDPTQVTEDIP